MSNPANNIKLTGSAVTNVGRVRGHNEDNIHLWTGESLMLAIVADGMGGAVAGEEASRIAVETIMQQLDIEAQPFQALDLLEDELSQAVQAANLSIMREARAHPRQRGMGTTVTMVFIRGQIARFAHVGDSRAYRVNRHGHIEQITSDHSFVQALLDAGHISEEQAETHPMGNVLYRALGQTEDLDVDTYNTFLSPGDRLVLCSDGLTRHVRAREIAQVASKMANPNMISQQLINMANERGGEDNISVITVVVDSQHISDDEAAESSEDDTIVLEDKRSTMPPGTPNTPYDARAEIDPPDIGAQREPHSPGEDHEASLPSHEAFSQTGRHRPTNTNAEGRDRSYPK